MPCTDGGVPYRTEDTARVNLNARVACSALALLEQINPLHITTLPAETQRWWANHKADDERRIAAEKAAEEREALKQTALGKLTAAEARALGIR